MNKDTIVAVSTALGKSAVNIVRMSGDEAIEIASQIFLGQNLEHATSHTVHYGKILDESDPVDEVLITLFREPKSFTTENIIEIHCHGGIHVTNRIVTLCIKHGARLAKPGEFTERAFLNGRIDLAQAESIMDIVEARTNTALTLANKGLSGEISTMITSLQDDLLEIIAGIEVHIDYPEYDDAFEWTAEHVIPACNSLIQRMIDVLIKAEDGKIIRDGIKTAIIGKPNVGKSSLLNALLGEDKAIVTDISGTTRDLVEGYVQLGHITLHLIDTAGIHESKDIIEKIGIDKAKRVLKDADLVLFVLDNNTAISKDDEHLLELTKDKKSIVIINKVDLESKLNRTFENSIAISALSKKNIDLIGKRVQEMFLSEDFDVNRSFYLSNVRHIGKMQQAKKSLEDALDAAEQQRPIDMIEIDLRDAWESLGDILGTTRSTALLDTLFSRFCLGK